MGRCLFRIVTVAAILVALAADGQAWARCCTADPSARDLRPAARPLTVTRLRLTGQVDLTWEAVSAEYRVFQGDLDRLHAERRLNDAEVATGAIASARLGEPAGNAYWLVSSRCHPLKCTRGRDSFGREREIPGCTTVEGGWLGFAEATCLLRTGPDGVVRTAAEHAAFAACFDDPSTAPPLVSGMAIAWAADQAPAACSTCLEFSCVQVTADAVVLRFAGEPVGDCDALHAGGPWAHVPLRPSISFQPEDPSVPQPASCP